MVEDERGSRKPRGKTATLSSGSNSVVTLINLRPQETLAIEQLRMQYDDGGTNVAVVEVYDEPDGTGSNDLNDKIDEFRLSPGDDVNPDMVWEDVEDDIVLYADGNSDDAITVTVGGFTVSG